MSRIQPGDSDDEIPTPRDFAFSPAGWPALPPFNSAVISHLMGPEHPLDFLAAGFEPGEIVPHPTDEYKNDPFYKAAMDFKAEYGKVSHEYSNLVDLSLNARNNLSHFKEDIKEYFSNLDIQDVKLNIDLTDVLKRTERMLTDSASQLEEKVTEKTKEIAIKRRLAKIYSAMDFENKYTCFLCLSKTSDTVFNPCHHVSCHDCAVLRSCPFCRSPVVSTHKIFFP